MAQKPNGHVPLRYRCIHPLLLPKSRRFSTKTGKPHPWRAKSGRIEFPMDVQHRSCSLLVAYLRRKRLGIHHMTYWSLGCNKKFVQRRLRAGLDLPPNNVPSIGWIVMQGFCFK